MIQVEIKYDEQDTNDWLTANKDKKIIDIKFSISTSDNETVEGYCIIYEQ